MTFQEFLDTYNGKYIDFDGAYGNQCMDLMHQYCVEVLGLTDGSILAAPCAKDVYNNFPSIKGHEMFQQIANTPEGVPMEGDIMFWGTGTWGHVAVFVEGDTSSFRSFDQNYPTGSPCHIQNHTYTGVLGWLRCTANTTLAVDKKVFEELVRKATIADEVGKILNKPINQDVILAEIKTCLSYEDTIIEKEKVIKEAQEFIAELEAQLKGAEDELSELSTKHIALTETVAKQEQSIKEATTLNQSLSMALQDLKAQLEKPIFTGWKLSIYKWLLGKG